MIVPPLHPLSISGLQHVYLRLYPFCHNLVCATLGMISLIILNNIHTSAVEKLQYIFQDFRNDLVQTFIFQKIAQGV